jgi:hypothetical protein
MFKPDNEGKKAEIVEKPPNLMEENIRAFAGDGVSIYRPYQPH